ncbi:hypothetical protein [Agromyces bauzanensis]|nr:hypothetical protein [Agromyces bauzanensis]
MSGCALAVSIEMTSSSDAEQSVDLVADCFRVAPVDVSHLRLRASVFPRLEPELESKRPLLGVDHEADPAGVHADRVRHDPHRQTESDFAVARHASQVQRWAVLTLDLDEGDS